MSIKMKTKKITQLILILVLLIPIASAISINIEMEDSFGIGEEISFNYTITSLTNQEIEYIVSVDCPNAPLRPLEIQKVTLEANTPLTKNYVYLSKVRDNINPQTCTAIVGIISPSEVLGKKSFDITTNPSFEFNILTCKNVNCSKQAKVFVLNEDIYLDYTSSVEDISVTVILLYPNKATQQLALPTSIKADQIGTYNLEITAIKEGYKTCLLYTSPSPRDLSTSRMPSSA